MNEGGAMKKSLVGYIPEHSDIKMLKYIFDSYIGEGVYRVNTPMIYRRKSGRKKKVRITIEEVK